jgi:hypothetical protein
LNKAISKLSADENRLGCLLNFGEALMKDGINRAISGELEPEPDLQCLGGSVREI